MNFQDFLNEGSKITLKRRYTENHPAIQVGKSATVRNKMLEAIADGKITQEEFDAILKELKRRSDSLNMQNLIIMVDREGDLSFSNEEQTKKAIENHKKWIDAAAYLGCHSIRVNLFGDQEPEIWAKNSVRSL